jgi:hypothetical protein
MTESRTANEKGEGVDRDGDVQMDALDGQGVADHSAPQLQGSDQSSGEKEGAESRVQEDDPVDMDIEFSDEYLQKQDTIAKTKAEALLMAQQEDNGVSAEAVDGNGPDGRQNKKGEEEEEEEEENEEEEEAEKLKKLEEEKQKKKDAQEQKKKDAQEQKKKLLEEQQKKKDMEEQRKKKKKKKQEEEEAEEEEEEEDEEEEKEEEEEDDHDDDDNEQEEEEKDELDGEEAPPAKTSKQIWIAKFTKKTRDILRPPKVSSMSQGIGNRLRGNVSNFCLFS